MRSGVAEVTIFDSGVLTRLVERVKFRNGLEAVHKVVNRRDTADSEALCSLVGRAIGAPVPAVVQIGAREIYMELMPGRPASELLKSRDQGLAYFQTREGLLLGVLDAITDNLDRNASNWLIADDGSISGIDHSIIAIGTWHPGSEPGTVEPGVCQSPFARHWLVRREHGRPAEWAPNVLHPSEVDTWLAAVAPLRREFTGRGYAVWWEAITGRLRAIRSHAEGTQPWLAAPAPRNFSSPQPTARRSPPSPSPRMGRSPR